MSNVRLSLALLISLAVGVRLGWSLTRTTDEKVLAGLPDQREYLELGRNLLHGDGLKFYDQRFDQTVFAFRTPLYPSLIALCRGDVRIVRAVQSLLDGFAVFAVYLLARRWLSERASLFGAGIVAFNPYLIYFSGLILTESLFTSMLLWSMALLTRASWQWFIGAALAALMVLVRPAAVALPLVIGIASALLTSPQSTARWRIPVGTTMLILTLAVLLPWAGRNRYVLGSWIWTSTNTGITSYDGFNPDATGASDQAKIAIAMPQLRAMGEIGRDAYLKQKAQEFIREQPVDTLKLAVIKIARTWSPRPLSAEFGRPHYVAIALAYSIPLDVIVLLALYRGSLPRSAKIFLLLPALYFTASSAISVGSLRYRIPAEPLLAVVAASVRFSRPGFKRYEPESMLAGEASNVSC